MYKEKIVIGLMPTRRPIFKLETAKAEKDLIMPIIRAQLPGIVEFVDVDDIVLEGMGAVPDDIDKVVEKFQRHHVDALFFPFCDFGCEEVVVGVAKQFNLPVLIWGTRDKVSTYEKREKETQCGLFAATKVLRNYGVTYSYIWNCEYDSPDFPKGFDTFVRTAAVVKALRNLNVAEIGDRPKDFYSVIHNQLQLIQNMNITVKPIQLSAITALTNEIMEKKDKTLQDYYADYTGRVDCSEATEDYIWKLCAGTLAIEQLMIEHKCKCAAFDCGGVSRAIGLGGSACAIEGELADRGFPTACETDVWGAISSLICQAASLGMDTPFLADWTYRHPTNDNAELIWHGGPFSHSLATKERKPRIKSRQSPWGIWHEANWELKQGDITMMRLDELDGKYYMFVGEGKSTDGPETTGTYVWMEVDSWKKWEEKLMFGPYIHHVAGIYGKYVPVLREACRYLGIEFDPVDKQGPHCL